MHMTKKYYHVVTDESQTSGVDIKGPLSDPIADCVRSDMPDDAWDTKRRAALYHWVN